MEGPLVTVGVPVYRGQDWVATTLECLRTQSYSKLDVLISIDGPDPASLAACRPFLADRRFRLEAQSSRRGWAENINWTMSQRRGEFFIFQQQDDQVSPTYIADLVAAAARYPKAAICYSKMEVSGIESGMVRHKPLLGHPAKRVLTYLERMDTSMFLGLIRSAAIAPTSGLPTNAFDSFGAELPFMAELARVGEFRFVEGPTYFKRLHGRNTHLQWYAWPEDRKRAAWLRLAVAMVDAVVPAGKSLTERRHLFYSVLDRFLTARGHRRWSFCKLDDGDTETRRAMVRTMIELLRESRLDLPACLESRSDAIERLIARRFEMFTRLEPQAASLPA